MYQALTGVRSGWYGCIVFVVMHEFDCRLVTLISCRQKQWSSYSGTTEFYIVIHHAVITVYVSYIVCERLQISYVQVFLCSQVFFFSRSAVFQIIWLVGKLPIVKQLRASIRELLPSKLSAEENRKFSPNIPSVSHDGLLYRNLLSPARRNSITVGKFTDG